MGAGACGLAAALRAAEGGASVAVVEKLDRLMGNTSVSSGSVPGAGTRFQRAAGIEDGPEAFLEDLLRISGPHEAEALARRLADISAPLIEWLVDHAGLEMTLITAYRHIGHRVARLHEPPSRRGRDLLEGLYGAAQRAGVTVAFRSPARSLIEDGAGGVAGAVLDTGSRIGAGAVILACNGFGADQELLERFCPDIAGALYFGAPGSQDEALRWGEAFGPAVANLGAYQAHASVAEPHAALVAWTVVEKGGLIVDATGLCFGDETLGYSAFAALETARPAPRYAIYDRRVRDFTASRQEEFAELVAHRGAPEDPTIVAALDVMFGRKIRLSLLTPFMQVGDAAARALFENAGHEVVRLISLKAPGPAAIARIPRDRIVQSVRDLAGPEVDAIVQVGTNAAFRTVACEMEAELGTPVLAANSVLY